MGGGAGVRWKFWMDSVALAYHPYSMAETWFTAAASTVLPALSEAAEMYAGFKAKGAEMRSFADEDIEF